MNQNLPPLGGTQHDVDLRYATRGRSFAVAPLALLLLGGLAMGCATYTAQPVNAELVREAWEGRGALDDPALLAYANRLFAERLSTGAAVPPFDATDGLTVDEAIAVAWMYNPALRLARAEAMVPHAASLQAGGWPDGEIDLEGDRLLETVPEQWVGFASLRLTIPISGRPGLEREQLRAAYGAALERLAVEEAEVATLVRHAWLDYAAAKERRNLHNVHAAAIEEVAAVARRMADSKQIARPDAEAIGIAQDRLILELLDADAEEADARRRILELLGLMPDAPITLVSTLTPASTANLPARGPDGAARLRRIDAAHPRVALARAEHQVAERTVEYEIAGQWMDPSISLGLGNPDGENRIGFGITLPLPALDGNRVAIARARAERDVTAAAFAATLEALTHELASTELDREAYLRRASHLRDTLLPRVEAHVAQLGRLAVSGQFDALLLLDALDSILDTREAVLDTRIGLSQADTALVALLDNAPPAEPTPASERANESSEPTEPSESTQDTRDEPAEEASNE